MHEALAPRTLALLLILAAGSACDRHPRPEPAALTESRELDAEVLALVQQKLAAARAAPGEARAHGTLGLVYEASQLWELAAASFGHAAEIDPADAWWRYHRAIALREMGQVGEALELLTRAAGELERSAAAQHRLAQWLLENGDLEAARAAGERALALSPEHPDVLVTLARVRAERGEAQLALDLAQRALRKDPGSRTAHYAAGLALRSLGRGAEAERELSAGLNAAVRYLDDPLSAEFASYRVNFVSQIERATQAMAAGQYAQALPLLERVLKKRPDDKIVLNNLAACLQETGQPALAVEHLKHALAVDPNEFATYLNLADSYLRLNQPAEALRDADQAVKLAPQLGRAHLMRAQALAALGSREEAYAALRQSLRLDASNPTTYGALAETCALLKRTEEARAWCAKLIEIDPNHVQGRLNLALLSLQLGDRNEAARQLSVLQRIAPQNERVLALQRELEKPTPPR